jgi:hypothetical protein
VAAAAVDVAPGGEKTMAPTARRGISVAARSGNDCAGWWQFGGTVVPVECR